MVSEQKTTAFGDGQGACQPEANAPTWGRFGPSGEHISGLFSDSIALVRDVDGQHAAGVAGSHGDDTGSVLCGVGDKHVQDLSNRGGRCGGAGQIAVHRDPQWAPGSGEVTVPAFLDLGEKLAQV